jgi:ABC-type amino acid transport substrate-binding protein
MEFRPFCRRTLLLAACAATLGPSWAASPVLDRLRQGEPLVIAHRESSLPFSYLDGQGKPVGYAVDLCHKIAEAVRQQLKLKSLPLRYRQVTGADRIEVIRSHQADLECGSTTNNAERREKVAFTVPHYITGARYLVPASSTVKELTDFDGKKLVSTQGTTPLKAISKANRERLLHISVLEAPDHAKAMAMVVAGQADGFAMDDVLLYGLIAGQPDPRQYRVVGKLLTIEPLAIMLPKDDPEFKQLVDEEMKRLIRSGEAKALYERWFMQPIAPRNTALNLPMNYLLKDFWKYPSDQVPF